MSKLYYYKSSLNGMSEMDIVKRLLRDKNICIDFWQYPYNVDSIISYDCKGYDLIGSSCNVNDSNRHFIVKNNHYRVYEVPVNTGKSSKLRMTGDFIVIFHNLDFGYWTFAYMKHRFVGGTGGITEYIHYHCYGEVELSADEHGKIHWICITGEGKCCRGFRGKVFDDDNIRKEVGYHTTWKVINKRYGWQKI